MSSRRKPLRFFSGGSVWDRQWDGLCVLLNSLLSARLRYSNTTQTQVEEQRPNCRTLWKKNINSVNNLSVIRDGNRIELQFLKTLNGTGQNINSKHHEMKRNQSNASHCKLLRLIISLGLHWKVKPFRTELIFTFFGRDGIPRKISQQRIMANV